MAFVVHRDSVIGENHIIHNFEYADATARAAASLASTDVGKVARQQDDGTFWLLLNHSPMTWAQVAQPESAHVIPQFIQGFEIASGVYGADIVRVYEGIAAADDDSITMEIGEGSYLDASLETSGANGLDTGSEQPNTWYAVFVIYNPTTLTTALLLSESQTSPTMPSGYTKKRFIGFVRNGGSPPDLIPCSSALFGSCRKCCYDGQYPVLQGGVQTAWTDVDLSDYVPPTGRLFNGHARVTGAATEIGYLRVNGSTATARTIACFRDGMVFVEMQMDVNQLIEYQVISGGTMDIYLYGYIEKL